MVKLAANSWASGKSESGRGASGLYHSRASATCTTSRSAPYVLFDLPASRLVHVSGSSWSVYLVFCLLLLSHLSEECPNTCQCKWKSGKESVSCFRASLTKIPQGLDPGTQVLNMSGNTMKSLPSHVFLSLNLLNLQRIFLSECELVSMERHVFSKLTNLVELDLSGNRLEVIPSHTFPEIPELRELKMNSNPISRISNDAFASLRRLVRLELTSCQLSTIETWAFRELPALEWLRLDNNRLLTVQAESFFPLQSLHGLKMNGNPWNCSCALKPLRDWMLRNNVPFEGIPPICQEPLRLQGKPWDRLQLQDFACLPKLENLTQDERIRRVIEGHNTTFVCRLQATADTHVSWLLGSKGVSVSNGSSGWSGGSGGMVMSETFAWKSEEMEEWGGDVMGGGGLDRSLGLKISVLTIIRTTPRDAGVYTCKGESRAGSVAANFSLVVLQNKAENLSGRLLFTGTLVAAILTLLVCLLLSCVCLVGRHRRTTTTAASSVNANFNSQHHHHHQPPEPHDPDKIELNHISVSQNGGSSLPILKNHSQYNHTHANPISNSISPVNNANNSLLNRRPERITDRSQDYKALPTNDPDDNFGEDTGKKSTSLWTKDNKNPNSPFHKIPGEDGDGVGVPITSTSSAPTRSSSLDDSDPTRGSSTKRMLSPTKSSPTKPTTKSYKFNPSNSGTLSKSQSQSSTTRDEQQSETQSGRDKFPDLIHEKMSMSFTTTDFVSLPRPNRNHDTRPSYFHRRMNSESQSPLLSSSSAHHSYSNSVETHSLTSSESLAYSTSLLGEQQQPHGHRLHHPPHHHSHSHHSQQQHQQQHHRLSMPTSPLHESHGATYDYHAAQLAAFLEEYRLLQLELMRMSASLNQTQTQATPPAQSLDTNVNDLSIVSPLGGSAQNSSNSNPITSPGSSSLSISANHQQFSSSHPNQVQNPAHPKDLSHNHQHQQQLKSILKNPSHNNNYMA